MKKIKVLHVLEATLGGTRRYLQNIAAMPDGSRYSWSLAYATGRADSGFNDLLVSCRDSGWGLYEIPMVREIHPYDDFRAMWSLRRLVRKSRPDIVHCHSSKAAGVGRLALRGLGKNRIRLAYSPHAIAAHLGKRYLALERILSPFTDLFIAVSHAEAEELLNFGVADRERIAVVHQAVDLKYFQPVDIGAAKTAVGIRSCDPVVAGFGRLAEQKNPLEWVSIVASVKEAIPELRAVWIGDGELRPQMVEAIRHNGLDECVQILGWVKDVRPHLAAADVVLLTSRYEGISTTAAEALAMCRPVVGTRVAGMVEVVRPPETGLLFDPGDVESAAAAVSRFLQNQTLANMVGMQGRALVMERFSVEVMETALMDAYRRLVCV